MNIISFVPKKMMTLVKYTGIYSLMALVTGCISHPATWPPTQDTTALYGMQRFSAQPFEIESDGRCWQKGRVCLNFDSKTLNN